jgi:molybdopterin molybdotransferase
MKNKEIMPQSCCEDELNTGLLTVAEAQARILEGVTAVEGSETLPLRDALNRVLAENIVSPINVPSHTNSAMDGYALRAADLPADGVREFPVPGTSWAGRPYLGPGGPGEAIQIMTGGMMPEGADTVVMQEQVERDGDTVRIGSGHKPGQNVTAADIGVLASLGLAEVCVYRRLKVAFFSTGDELRAVGETLGPGEIHDSNRYTLYGVLKKLDVEIIDMGVVRDERELIEQAFKEAADSADVIITSGGVSVGEADPVSVMVTFFQFVRPALLKMCGETDAASVYTVRARTTTALRKRPGRFEFQRGVLEQAAPGEFTVRVSCVP